jgi:hypothetical protein
MSTPVKPSPLAEAAQLGLERLTVSGSTAAAAANGGAAPAAAAEQRKDGSGSSGAQAALFLSG